MEPITSVCSALRDAVETVAVPFLDRLSAPELVLNAYENDSLRLMDSAKLTLTCGAIVSGRPDLARRVLAGLGAARRRDLALVLDLSGSI
jgi:hypothetical protein